MPAEKQKIDERVELSKEENMADILEV